jgi:hypothetical protein
MYEENYFEREAEKKSWLEKLGDNLSYVEPIKDALNHLAIHHIRHHAPPQRNDPAVVERKEFLDAAVKLKIIDEKLNLIDGWLTGYYAARSPDFEREAWDTVLEDVHQNPDRSELIIRYLVASASAEQTQNWDMLGLDAPVVMDIASQEWLAMDRSSRKSMMRRFGIPHDDEGRLDFPPEHDFMECELPELLALLHFHCSIADTEGWHSPEENTDTQWEVLFTALTMRYYGELKDKLGEKEKFNIWGRKFALGESLDAFPDQMEGFLEELFGESHSRGLSRITKLVPYNHHKESHKGIITHDVVYCGNAVPSPLLRVIEGGIGGSIGELQSLIFAVGMIEIHAQRTLFKLSRAVLEEFVPSAYEIQKGPWQDVRIMLHRIIGYRKRQNNSLIGKCTGMQLQESNLGIPLEITFDKDLSLFARRFLSAANTLADEDEEFLPLEGIGGALKLPEQYYVNDELRAIWPEEDPGKQNLIKSGYGIGVKILEVELKTMEMTESLSTLIIPDYDLNQKLTRQKNSLFQKRNELNAEVKRLKKLRADRSTELKKIRSKHRELKASDPNSSSGLGPSLREAEIAQEKAHKLLLPVVKEAQLAHDLGWKVSKELELHSSGGNLRQHRMKDIVDLLPSCEKQTTTLLNMRPWFSEENWFKDEDREYWTTLPSEDSRLIRMIKAPVGIFITPRLKLQWMMPKPYFPYLVSFRGEGFAADTEPVANVVSMNFSKGLLYWIIGREGRTQGSCVYRQPNTDFAEAYREFMEIDNRRFQPWSVFEDIDKKLKKLRKTGKVSVYLKRNEKQIGDKTHRVLLVPETDWQDRGFTDLTYELGHPDEGIIEKAFSSLYSEIPGAPVDAHLNRWYAVDFVMGSNDNSGERYLFPDHETIEPLCQLCAAETIEIEGDPEQLFICKGCSEWFIPKPKNEEE